MGTTTLQTLTCGRRWQDQRADAAILAASAGQVAALLAIVAVGAGRAAASEGPETRMLARAIKLLPQAPTVPIRFIDPELAADSEAVSRLDAFLVTEPDGTLRQVIYLNRRSAVVENALGGRDLDIGILATVIQHELEHLRGGDERQARRVEREFFKRLTFEGRVPLDEGLAYLLALEQHYPLRER
jgi:hypothetical protein